MLATGADKKAWADASIGNGMDCYLLSRDG